MVDTSRNILDAASSLFDVYGYDKTSMDDIARRAHRSKRSLYNYYATKEELFEAVVARDMDRVHHALLESISVEEQLPSQRIRSYLISRMQLLSDALGYRALLRRQFQSGLGQVSVVRSLATEQFDRWEYNMFLQFGEDISSSLDAQIKPVAFAKMLQMIMKSMEVQFFVQCKFDSYFATYQDMIALIVDSMVYKFNSKVEENGQLR